MSFTIKLLKTGSPLNQVTKTYTEIAEVEGTLKEGSSLIDPVILFDSTIADLRFCNFIYIDSFKRFYIVNDIQTIRSYLVELSAHVDVLATYGNAIKANVGIIKRNRNAHNTLLNDGFFKVYQNPHVVLHEFPSGFSTQEWVLAMAGS